MRRLLLSLLALPLLLLGIAAPASAQATIVAFTANGTSGNITVAPGSPLTLAWEVTGDDDLVVTADVDWSGTKPTVGSETITAPGAGGLAIYQLTATDGSGQSVSRSIVVDTESAPAGSTPAPVTIADCVVTVPASEEFDYVEVLDGDDEDAEVLDAGTYTVSDLTFDGLFEVTIVAQPRRGVTVADGAVTEFEVPFTDDCASEKLIEATAGSCSFEVENVSDAALTILYGDPEAENADGVFTLAAGQSRTVPTSRASLIVVGVVDVDDDDTSFDIAALRISRDGCGAAGGGTGSGPRWPVPVNAPAAGVSAAGVTTGSGSAPWLLAGLVIAGGLAAGSVRRRAAS